MEDKIKLILSGYVDKTIQCSTIKTVAILECATSKNGDFKDNIKWCEKTYSELIALSLSLSENKTNNTNELSD